MRQHWMAIPLGAVSPFVVLALVLSQTEGWSNGALGVVVLGLLGIACAVGSLMMPIDPETGKLIEKDSRPRRSR
jgi:hypothetical protein